MASLGGMGVGAVAVARIVKTKATTKSAEGAGGAEKNLFNWILGSIQKEDQFYETDPILQKVGEKGGNKNGTTSGKSTTSVPFLEKKSGGFGGFGDLFAQNQK